MASPQASTRRRTAVQLERSAPERLPLHPDAPRFQRWQRWAISQKKPIAVDLFCGSGGLSLGLEDAGYVIALSVDNDPWALETHAHNLPGVVLDLDLSDPRRIDHLVRLLEGLPIDLVAGGPPCQPFSRAGRSKIRSLVEDGVHPAQDERAELWQSFLAVVERVRPNCVLMENVPDMALGDDLAVIRILSARLERLEYDVEFRLLDAWRHGVPQHRQRLVLIARRDGRPITWPKEQKPVTLRQAIGDLPKLGVRSTGARVMPVGRSRTAFQRRARRGMNGERVVWDHVTRPVRDDDLEAFRLMKPGTRYGDLPKRLRRYRADIFNDKYNRLAWDDLSRSITAHIAKDGYWYIHPEEHRTLTVREAARIQTYPDSFRFAGTRSHAFRQIGNAVPPALAEAIGRELVRSGRGKPLPAARRPGAWLRGTRQRLLDWARADAERAPWRHPGDPWKVLAGVVLADRVSGRDEAAREFLERFPRPARGDSARIRKAATAIQERESAGYERLAAASLALLRLKGQGDRWLDAADLGAAEEALVRTIALAEDRVLATAPVLRVAGRLTGTKIADERRLSDGRIVIGWLVGAGGVGPALTASLHALGRTICTSSTPDCRHCPVRRFCEHAKRGGGS